MSGCIIICPIGHVDDNILCSVAECIEARCPLRCDISMKMENPRYAYDIKRNQYNSKMILERLLTACPRDAARFMGITSVDLFVPILKFVFGLALIDGRCSVISMHRLRPEFHGRPPDTDLLIQRLKKTAMHELGHSMALTHCRDRRCVMYSSTRIEDTDFKKTDFCPTCAELFKWNMETQAERFPRDKNERKTPSS